MEAPTASDLDRPAPQPSPDPLDESTDRIVLGVAGYLADGIGVDALWVRLTFVVLSLVGGIGVLAYFALWLVVFGPARTGLPVVRYVGGTLLVAVVPLVIGEADLGFVSGPVAVVALLLGLTLALWQPRRAPSTEAPSPRSFPPPTSGTSSHPQAPVRSPRVPRPPRTRAQPSMLGRLTFGSAVIAAAVGALIDYFNGGRLHPEQWLGAAALVCGIGLLIGAVRGRARWLIVPALVFAFAGYITGLMTRVGLDAGDAFGNSSAYINESTPGGTQELSQAIGDMWISIDGAPQNPVTIDATAAIGSLQISVSDTVSVEIRSDSDRGDLTVNGVVSPDGSGHLGPDTPPDVIVDARLGIGDVRASSYEYVPPPAPGTQPLLSDGALDTRVLDHAFGVQVDDGIGITSDGWIVLAYGEALIAPDDSVIVGSATTQTPNLTMVSTQMGVYQLDGGVLRTPWGTEYDLTDLRRQFSPDATPVTAPTTISPAPPATTVAPSTVDTTAPATPTTSIPTPSNTETPGG